MSDSTFNQSSGIDQPRVPDRLKQSSQSPRMERFAQNPVDSGSF